MIPDGPWALVWYAEALWEGSPPATPPSGAELSADQCWASTYSQGRATATWTRTRGLDERERRELAELAESRKARRRADDHLQSR